MSLKNWLSFGYLGKATGGGGAAGGGADDGGGEEEEGPPMERDHSAPIFYIFPPTLFDLIKPAKDTMKTEYAERAIANTGASHVPVFYVLPKSLVASFFPPRAGDSALAPASGAQMGPWSFVMCILGACGAFTSLS